MEICHDIGQREICLVTSQRGICLVSDQREICLVSDQRGICLFLWPLLVRALIVVARLSKPASSQKHSSYAVQYD